ncbi:DUF488 domain-containing protein [Asticcacaulis taihuensis]|uniref:DUF488 domain-containing protein n=1 Tax=Asticcacaulis taihuensis TaxID=260084 RepID=UPI003F7CD08B
MNSELEILTIGHSTQSYEDFRRRLQKAMITAVADVRSMPFSKHLPHFNKNVLKDELKRDNIAYVFIGEELGGRPKSKELYRDGVADYEKMALEDSFRIGIARVIEGAKKYKIALMCSEHDPLDCHRCLLVGRALVKNGVRVAHINGNGNKIEHSQIEDWLLDMSGDNSRDMFDSKESRLAIAYRNRAMKVAYSDKREPTERNLEEKEKTE